MANVVNVVCSQQANQQTESLQQQLHMLAGQRDQAYLQVASLQDQLQQYAVSLNNLQMVLEQFQQGGRPMTVLTKTNNIVFYLAKGLGPLCSSLKESGMGRKPLASKDGSLLNNEY